MKCPYCNQELSDGTPFCTECGQKVNQQELTYDTSNVSQNYWNEYKSIIAKEESKRKAFEKREIEKSKKNRRTFIIIIISIIVVVALLIYFLIIIPSQSHSQTQKLLTDKHETTGTSTHLGNYEDSTDMADLDKYNEAIVEYEKGQYKDALSLLYSLSDYENSRYYIDQCELELLRNSKNNDIITLGNYQGNPIEWIILSKSSSDALLVSNYYVDTKIANESDEGEYGKYTCWSGSTLRKWLNEEFISTSFSSEVAELLLSNTITTYEYDLPNYDGWHEKEITVTTEDKVYIPSVEDRVKHGLKPTSILGSESTTPVTGWLRDRGRSIAFQVTFEPNGSYGNEWHFYSSYGIRPMIRISLDGNASPNLSKPADEESSSIPDNNSQNVDTNSPFNQDYWVIFTEGFRGDRVEAASVNSSLSSDSIYIVWDSALYLNDTSGSDTYDQYLLGDNNQWSQIGSYSRFTDNATNIIASNLDIYDSSGNLVLAKCSYKDVDWDLINSYQ